MQKVENVVFSEIISWQKWGGFGSTVDAGPAVGFGPNLAFLELVIWLKKK